jgi:hypothetical protein
MQTEQRRDLAAALPFLTRAFLIGIGLWVVASVVLAIPLALKAWRSLESR